jgi:hypothetical protein
MSKEVTAAGPTDCDQAGSLPELSAGSVVAGGSAG